MEVNAFCKFILIVFFNLLELRIYLLFGNTFYLDMTKQILAFGQLKRSLLLCLASLSHIIVIFFSKEFNAFSKFILNCFSSLRELRTLKNSLCIYINYNLNFKFLLSERQTAFQSSPFQAHTVIFIFFSPHSFFEFARIKNFKNSF